MSVIEVLTIPDFGGICKEINDSVTVALDHIYGPDKVDASDASCNTCKHFQRKSMNAEEKRERNIFGMPGLCSLKGVSVRGWQRGQFCGFENASCYENRRTGRRHGGALA